MVLFLLNEKRHNLSEIEIRHNLTLQISARSDMRNGDFDIRVEDADGKIVEPQKPQFVSRPRPPRPPEPDQEEEEERTREPRRPNRNRRNKAASNNDNLAVIDGDADGDEAEGPVNLIPDGDEKDDAASNRKRRRRGRRGGRRRRKETTTSIVELSDEKVAADGGAVLDAAAADVLALVGEDITVLGEARQAARTNQATTPSTSRTMTICRVLVRNSFNMRIDPLALGVPPCWSKRPAVSAPAFAAFFLHDRREVAISS